MRKQLWYWPERKIAWLARPDDKAEFLWRFSKTYHVTPESDIRISWLTYDDMIVHLLPSGLICIKSRKP